MPRCDESVGGRSHDTHTHTHDACDPARTNAQRAPPFGQGPRRRAGLLTTLRRKWSKSAGASLAWEGAGLRPVMSRFGGNLKLLAGRSPGRPFGKSSDGVRREEALGDTSSDADGEVTHPLRVSMTVGPSRSVRASRPKPPKRASATQAAVHAHTPTCTCTLFEDIHSAESATWATRTLRGARKHFVGKREDNAQRGQLRLVGMLVAEVVMCSKPPTTGTYTCESVHLPTRRHGRHVIGLDLRGIGPESVDRCAICTGTAGRGHTPGRTSRYPPSRSPAATPLTPPAPSCSADGPQRCRRRYGRAPPHQGPSPARGRASFLPARGAMRAGSKRRFSLSSGWRSMTIRRTRDAPC